MGATDNAVNRTKPMAAEVGMRRSNRLGYIRQLYIDELKYNSGKLEDANIPPRKLSDIKHKIRVQLKKEARKRFAIAATCTILIVAVLAIAFTLLVKYS